MIRKLWLIASIVLLTVLMLGVIVVVAKESDPPHKINVQSASDASEVAQYTYKTVITVTSGTDPTTSKSETCYTGTGSDRSPCTLRRAVVESRGLSAGDRPVLIAFDIPQDAAEGYNSSLGIWKIELAGSTADDLREFYGETIVDGGTQTGGRGDGPKIIIDGQGKKNYGFILRNGDNMVVGVAMQNFKTAHISVSSDGNTIEENWFGLSDSGMLLSSGDETTPEESTAVALAAGSDDNVIHGNRFAGFKGASVAIRGDRNEFTGNWVGMRADGTVPIPFGFDRHPCMGSTTWAGGSGITVEGDDHHIGGPDASDGNRFAGLYLDIFGESEPPFAMEFKGSNSDVLIQNNVIGLDARDDTIGICGRGIKLSNGPEGTQVISNAIVEPGLSAIVMNHWTLNGNTLRGNIIKRESAWPGEQGDNTFPEGAIAYGDKVPEELSGFKPAKITEIDGTSVMGTSGTGSPCPSCTVELFLDDRDTVVEALASLDLVMADGDGNWTATLPAPLEENQALRTMSTVPSEFTIIGLDGGTTSNLSMLYVEGYRIFLPLVLRRF